MNINLNSSLGPCIYIYIYIFVLVLAYIYIYIYHELKSRSLYYHGISMHHYIKRVDLPC